MRPLVTVRLKDGVACDLGPGAIIGRLWSAELVVDDPRVSEAHAMVSLRGGELKLLSLRGLFSVSDKPINELTFQVGQKILLARGLELEVMRVVLPREILAFEGEDLPRSVLEGVASLVTRPRPMLVPRYQEGAAARIWTTGEGWRIAIGEEEGQLLTPGTDYLIDGRAFRAVMVPLAGAGQVATRIHGAVMAPLRIVARFDTVHIHREGEPVLVLTGILARLISELVMVKVAVSWEALAAGFWPEEDDRAALRNRWDVAVARLRSRLKGAGIRTDLIKADGSGNVELLLNASDRIEDQT